ncbi:UNVERIFIED_ORG: NADPH:quinone reductase-like Zn-dependent oxidoreductase [Rhizobium esperanzae]
MGKQDEATKREVVALAAQGKLKISISRTVPLDSAIDLIRSLEGGERIAGKGFVAVSAQ